MNCKSSQAEYVPECNSKGKPKLNIFYLTEDVFEPQKLGRCYKLLNEKMSAGRLPLMALILLA